MTFTDDELDDDYECDHGCVPAEICDECAENGCNFSEEEECTCWMRDMTMQ